MLTSTKRSTTCFTVSGDSSVVIDPYADNKVPGLAPLSLSAGAVLCSHEHDDHNYIRAVRRCGSADAFCIKKLETFHDEEKGALRGKNTIHLISAGGIKAAHMGDIGCFLSEEQISLLAGLDALLIPVGGYYTIDAAAAKEIVSLLSPAVVIPMHYSSKDFGFSNIAPVDNYLSLCSDVVYYPGNEIEIIKGMPRQTAVLKYLLP